MILGEIAGLYGQAKLNARDVIDLATRITHAVAHQDCLGHRLEQWIDMSPNGQETPPVSSKSGGDR